MYMSHIVALLKMIHLIVVLNCFSILDHLDNVNLWVKQQKGAKKANNNIIYHCIFDKISP